MMQLHDTSINLTLSASASHIRETSANRVCGMRMCIQVDHIRDRLHDQASFSRFNLLLSVSTIVRHGIWQTAKRTRKAIGKQFSCSWRTLSVLIASVPSAKLGELAVPPAQQHITACGIAPL
jgi:hypothetical protein